MRVDYCQVWQIKTFVCLWLSVFVSLSDFSLRVHFRNQVELAAPAIQKKSSKDMHRRYIWRRVYSMHHTSLVIAVTLSCNSNIKPLLTVLYLNIIIKKCTKEWDHRYVHYGIRKICMDMDGCMDVYVWVDGCMYGCKVNMYVCLHMCMYVRM